MIGPPSRLGALLAAATLLLATARAHGQTETFDDRITVSEVEIPIRALADGEPVRGLGADDFEVLEDGRRLEIVGFRVLDLSSRSAATEGTEAGAESKPAPDGAREGRALLYLFDLDFSRRRRLIEALGGIRTTIAEDLHPADRVAVAYVSDARLRLLYGFTEDPEIVELGLGVVESILDLDDDALRRHLAALRATGGATSGAELAARFGTAGAARVAAGTADVRIVPAPSVARDRGDDEQRGRNGPRLTGGDAVSLIRAHTVQLGRLTALLADVSGQKHLVYLSEGFPSSLVESPRSGERALVLGHLRRLLRDLRGAGWTAHGIDVEGIPAAGAAGFDAHTLLYLSEETGGDLYENYNRIEVAGERLAERTSVVYVVTVRPGPVEPDGAFHPLEVRLTDRVQGVELKHRRGYHAPDRTATVASRGATASARTDAAVELLSERVRRGERLAIRLAPRLVDAEIAVSSPAGVRGWERVHVEVEVLSARSASGRPVALLATESLVPGEYRLELRVDDELVERATFRVEEP